MTKPLPERETLTNRVATDPSGAPTDNDIAVAIEAGQRIGRPVTVGDDYVLYLNPVTGETTVLDLVAARAKRERDELEQTPPRKKGEVTLRTAESLVAYVTRHGGEGTELWADLEAQRIVAYLNGDTTQEAGHRDFKASLALRKTDGWTAWENLNGALVDQEKFAEHIEARSIDVLEPTGAELLDIVQTIKQTTAGEFESAKRLSDGQTVLSYREQTTTTAGSKGEFSVPERFVIAVAPFEGASPFKVTAHLRTRVREGRLQLGYVLERPEDVIKAAFEDVLKHVEDNLPNYPLFNGAPVSYRY